MFSADVCGGLRESSSSSSNPYNQSGLVARRYLDRCNQLDRGFVVSGFESDSESAMCVFVYAEIGPGYTATVGLLARLTRRLEDDLYDVQMTAISKECYEHAETKLGV